MWLENVTRYMKYWDGKKCCSAVSRLCSPLQSLVLSKPRHDLPLIVAICFIFCPVTGCAFIKLPGSFSHIELLSRHFVTEIRLQ